MGLLALLQAVGRRPAVANDWNTMVMKDKKLRYEQLKQDIGVHNKDIRHLNYMELLPEIEQVLYYVQLMKNILSAFGG